MPETKPKKKYKAPASNPVMDYNIDTYLKTYDYNWPTLKHTDENTQEIMDLLDEIPTPELDTSVIVHEEFGKHYKSNINFDGFDEKLTNMCKETFTNKEAADPEYYKNLDKSWFEKIRSRSKNGTYKIVQKRSVLSLQSLNITGPANIPLSFDPSAGLGVSLPLPTSLTDIIVQTLEITEKKGDSLIENLILSSASKSVLSKLFWAVLIRFYRYENKNPFNPKQNDPNQAVFEKLMNQLSWEYVNFLENFKNHDNQTTHLFIIYCSLSVQILFLLFHNSFPAETYGINFLIALNITVFEWLCGLKPRLDLLNMYPMEKLTGSELVETDKVPEGAMTILKQNFPKGDYKKNTGKGTIMLGMMSGLLDRYCKNTNSTGTKEILGVLAMRHIQRKFI